MIGWASESPHPPASVASPPKPGDAPAKPHDATDRGLKVRVYERPMLPLLRLVDRRCSEENARRRSLGSFECSQGEDLDGWLDTLVPLPSARGAARAQPHRTLQQLPRSNSPLRLPSLAAKIGLAREAEAVSRRGDGLGGELRRRGSIGGAPSQAMLQRLGRSDNARRQSEEWRSAAPARFERAKTTRQDMHLLQEDHVRESRQSQRNARRADKEEHESSERRNVAAVFGLEVVLMVHVFKIFQKKLEEGRGRLTRLKREEACRLVQKMARKTLRTRQRKRNNLILQWFCGSFSKASSFTTAVRATLRKVRLVKAVVLAGARARRLQLKRLGEQWDAADGERVAKALENLRKNHAGVVKSGAKFADGAAPNPEPRASTPQLRNLVVHISADAKRAVLADVFRQERRAAVLRTRRVSASGGGRVELVSTLAPHRLEKLLEEAVSIARARDPANYGFEAMARRGAGIVTCSNWPVMKKVGETRLADAIDKGAAGAVDKYGLSSPGGLSPRRPPGDSRGGPRTLQQAAGNRIGLITPSGDRWRGRPGADQHFEDD
ncbi:hypothetical protein M885DRAFT_509607 [Pelagophyceae sp. CCMP2097]|nr:hypothetical protein M885DRAFT_509607 [Pelagophyceae sp. CCMP2097]